MPEEDALAIEVEETEEVEDKEEWEEEEDEEGAGKTINVRFKTINFIEFCFHR